MNKIVIYASFFLWIIYFLSLCLKAYKNTDIHNFNNYFEWFKINYKKSFQISALILILMYIVFANFGNKTVDKLLFLTINLYLYVDFICENKDVFKNFKWRNYSKYTYIFLIFVAILPFEYYFLYKGLAITYIWLFLYVLFAYYIIGAIKYFSLKIEKYNKKSVK